MSTLDPQIKSRKEEQKAKQNEPPPSSLRSQFLLQFYPFFSPPYLHRESKQNSLKCELVHKKSDFHLAAKCRGAQTEMLLYLLLRLHSSVCFSLFLSWATLPKRSGGSFCNSTNTKDRKTEERKCRLINNRRLSYLFCGSCFDFICASS